MSVRTADRFLPKYMQLRDDLFAHLKQLPAGAALPTVSAIRSKYGVSQPTVDRAIQELRFEGLIDSRRGSGIYVTERAKARCIAIVFGFNAFGVGRPTFNRDVLAKFERRSSEKLYVRYYLHDMEEGTDNACSPQLQSDADAGRLDVILYMGAWRAPNQLEQLGLPIVALSIHPEAPRRAEVDAGSVVRRGVEALALQGRKNIAFFAHDNRVREQETRSFATAIAKAGATSRPEWEVRWSRASSLEVLGFREFLRWWPSLEIKPDALVCVDDNVTSGLLQAAEELGVKIPEELMIASHSNLGVSDFHGYPIIRMEVDLEEMVDLLLLRLEAAVNNQPADPPVLTIAPSVIIPGKLNR